MGRAFLHLGNQKKKGTNRSSFMGPSKIKKKGGGFDLNETEEDNRKKKILYPNRGRRGISDRKKRKRLSLERID